MPTFPWGHCSLPPCCPCSRCARPCAGLVHSQPTPLATCASFRCWLSGAPLHPHAWRAKQARGPATFLTCSCHAPMRCRSSCYALWAPSARCRWVTILKVHGPCAPPVCLRAFLGHRGQAREACMQCRWMQRPSINMGATQELMCRTRQPYPTCAGLPDRGRPPHTGHPHLQHPHALPVPVQAVAQPGRGGRGGL